MRGEYAWDAIAAGINWELPPRARRIRVFQPHNEGWTGTTSACAENTDIVATPIAAVWNYLRVRGEYSAPALEKESTWELPPRARRILSQYVDPKQVYGTTSACAENTYPYPIFGRYNRNYLRVRGEYTVIILTSRLMVELPPRARRILHDFEAVEVFAGTTSACAENTSWI